MPHGRTSAFQPCVVQSHQNLSSYQGVTFLLPCVMFLWSSFVLQVLVFLPHHVVASVYKKYQSQRNPYTSLGHSNFTKLVVESEIFVDKTLFIKDFLESPSDVIMVTCPRRWGKSMNIDMLKTFLQVAVGKNGTRVDKSDAANAKLFRAGDPRVPRLEIAKHRELMERYLGEHPVIHLSFSSSGGLTYKAVAASLRIVVSSAFEEHIYLTEIFWQIIRDPDTNITTKDLAKAHLDTFVKLYSQTANEIEVLQGLPFLSARLHEFCGKKVFILIDEFDKIINGLFSSAFIEISSKDVSLGMQYIQEFITLSFEKNENFQKALITGVTRPNTSKVFARLDKFQEHHMLHSDFYNHFGFTAEEVLELCRAFNFLPTQHANVTTCYGGYALINTPITLFNSDSVLRYLPEQIAQPYWEKEGDLGPYEGLFSEKNINNTVMAIMNGTAHDLNLNNLTLTTEDLFNLSHMVRGDTTRVPEESVALFLRLIFSHGYLTIDKERTLGSKNIAVVKVPNEEIATILREKLGVET